MKANVNEVEINGLVYVPKEQQEKEVAQKFNQFDYVIVRTKSAGVFAGYLKKRSGDEVEVVQARRIWYWDGAASLSQLAINGTNKPLNCKFPEAVERVTLLGTIEILYPTEEARLSIEAVPIWKK